MGYLGFSACTYTSARSAVGFLRSLHNQSKLKKIERVRAQLTGDHDPLLRAAAAAATLRSAETHRPEPLFVDPYVDCLVHPGAEIETKPYAHHHCLATKFIDDKLLHVTRNADGVRQVVLLTDGMDTRPYRLTWPSSTVIFDISPERVYQEASQRLKEVGAEVPRNCLLIHVSQESSNIQEDLRQNGFHGNRPSIWVLQGFPPTMASFEDILFNVGCLAMKGCILMGELPASIAETALGKCSKRKWMEKLFMSHGFQVIVIEYENVARSLARELSSEDYNHILFVAEHLRFSDDQMDNWRRELQKVEEVDEEGFEDL